MTTLYSNIADILILARQRSYRAVNRTMIEAYWLIGQQIVEEEQKGLHRAEYGAKLLPYLSQKLQKLSAKIKTIFLFPLSFKNICFKYTMYVLY